MNTTRPTSRTGGSHNLARPRKRRRSGRLRERLRTSRRLRRLNRRNRDLDHRLASVRRSVQELRHLRRPGQGDSGHLWWDSSRRCRRHTVRHASPAHLPDEVGNHARGQVRDRSRGRGRGHVVGRPCRDRGIASGRTVWTRGPWSCVPAPWFERPELSYVRQGVSGSGTRVDTRLPRPPSNIPTAYQGSFCSTVTSTAGLRC